MRWVVSGNKCDCDVVKITQATKSGSHHNLSLIISLISRIGASLVHPFKIISQSSERLNLNSHCAVCTGHCVLVLNKLQTNTRLRGDAVLVDAHVMYTLIISNRNAFAVSGLGR